MGDARQKLNGLWFAIAVFVALVAGGWFESFVVALVVLAILLGAMAYNGHIRATPAYRRGQRPSKGR